ncbi:hypothetical protein [Mesorhizobium sp. ESP7-2]|nr:hypothetical protein [Mesorhizobium sp. ESP7-2]
MWLLPARVANLCASGSHITLISVNTRCVGVGIAMTPSLSNFLVI